MRELYPEAGDVAKGRFWCGFRPMTPDGTPIIGKTPIENLYLNTGHGTLGWTMACGSAQLLADIIAEQPSQVPAGDYAVARYSVS